MTTKAQRAARDAARNELRGLLPVGSTVRVVIRSVARSGMSRTMSLFTTDMRDITHLAADAMGERITSSGPIAIRVGGCGMNMAFATVYGLSRSLYADGHPCIGEDARCPSNDHTNEWRAPNYSPDRVHVDGGYALHHRTV